MVHIREDERRNIHLQLNQMHPRQYRNNLCNTRLSMQ